MRARIAFALAAALVGCDGGSTAPSCEDSDCACELLDDVDLSDVPEAQVAFVVEQAMATTQHRWTEAQDDAIACRVVACDEDRVALEFESAAGDQRLELSTCGPLVDGTRPVAEADEVRACVDGESGWSVRLISGEVYEGAVGAPLCTLHTQRRGASLTGSFECSELGSDAGEMVRLSEGTFACPVEI